MLREIRAALDSLENFRAKDCAHKIEDILQYRLDIETKGRLKKIREQLMLYEDDAAEQLLQELIEYIGKEN